MNLFSFLHRKEEPPGDPGSPAEEEGLIDLPEYEPRKLAQRLAEKVTQAIGSPEEIDDWVLAAHIWCTQVQGPLEKRAAEDLLREQNRMMGIADLADTPLSVECLNRLYHTINHTWARAAAARSDMQIEWVRRLTLSIDEELQQHQMQTMRERQEFSEHRNRVLQLRKEQGSDMRQLEASLKKNRRHPRSSGATPRDRRSPEAHR